MKRGQQVKRFLIVIAGVGAFNFHFFNTVLANMPNNVISTKYTFDKRYVTGLIAQQWSMFAPRPMDQDNRLLIDCINSLSKFNTGYQNATQDFNRLRQRNIFTSSERLSRVPGNAVYLYLSPSRWEEKLKEACNLSKDEKQCKNLRGIQDYRKKTAKDTLILSASYYCRDISHRYNTTFDIAKLLIEVEPVPRWSERYSKKENHKMYAFVGEVPLSKVNGVKIWH